MILDSLTVKQIIKICQKHKIKNYSGLRKKQLIQHVNKFMNKKYKMNQDKIVILHGVHVHLYKRKTFIGKNNMKYTERSCKK